VLPPEKLAETIDQLMVQDWREWEKEKDREAPADDDGWNEWSSAEDGAVKDIPTRSDGEKHLLWVLEAARQLPEMEKAVVFLVDLAGMSERGAAEIVHRNGKPLRSHTYIGDVRAKATELLSKLAHDDTFGESLRRRWSADDEKRLSLLEAARQLPEMEKAVVFLVDLAGMSVRGAAALLGRSHTHIRNVRAKALELSSKL
jgi:DNA-directed RNA polymerase specialized sigma24 family protein